MANHKPKQGAQNQDNTLGDKEEEAVKLLHLVKSNNYLFHQNHFPEPLPSPCYSLKRKCTWEIGLCWRESKKALVLPLIQVLFQPPCDLPIFYGDVFALKKKKSYVNAMEVIR